MPWLPLCVSFCPEVYKSLEDTSAHLKHLEDLQTPQDQLIDVLNTELIKVDTELWMLKEQIKSIAALPYEERARAVRKLANTIKHD